MVGDVVRGLLGVVRRVVVVDDGSTDRTSARALEAGAVVLRHVVNRGQGAALVTGIRHALRRGARIVVTFDADGQHPPFKVPDLVGPIVRGEADIALGSRFLRDADAIPRARRLLLRAALVFTHLSSGLRVTDTHNGFRAFSRRAAELLDLQMDRMAHASEIIDRVAASGLPWVEVPVRVTYTPYSAAKGQRASGAVRVVWDYVVGRLLE